MSEGRRATLLAYLTGLGRGAASEDDAVLLERFAACRDEAAFAALLSRHGPLVWGICRRVLAEEHAAEDAFQATFLVLVRKAGSVSKRASLRSWLYGVALRVAVRARRQEGVRRLRERTSALQATMEVPEVDARDVQPILDEEIQRLPEKYRLPVILCYLEGRTNDDAARLLNCPRGTIATRLARAREKLRSRLVRRGLTLSAGGLATVLGEDLASAAVPPVLMSQTMGYARSGSASASITTLTEGVLRAMFVSKLKTTVGVIVALCVIGGVGVGTYYLRGQPPEPIPRTNGGRPPEQGAELEQPPVKFPEKIKTTITPPPAKTAETLRKILTERRDRAEREAKVRYEKYRAGAQDATLDLTIGSFKRLRNADLELFKDRADRLAIHERHLRLMREIAQICEAKYKVGRISSADYDQAGYERLDAEIEWEREKARK